MRFIEDWIHHKSTEQRNLETIGKHGKIDEKRDSDLEWHKKY